MSWIFNLVRKSEMKKRSTNRIPKNIVIRTYSTNYHAISSEKMNQMLDMLNEYMIEVHKWKRMDGDHSETILASNESLSYQQYIKTAESKTGNILGFVCYNKTNPGSSTIIEICKVVVNKSSRNMGIGSKLIRNIFDEYEGAQFEAHCVYERNEAAKKFWNSLGFCTKLYSTLIVNHTEY